MMRDPGQSLGFLIADLARTMRRDFNRRARDLGLSQAQWQALAHLSRQEGVNQVTLAETLEVQPITLARVIDRLQEAGLVERRPDPDDRRAFRLYLTGEAQPLLAEMWSLAGETEAEATSGLSDDTRRIVIEALARMKRNLTGVEGRSSDDGAGREGARENVTGRP